MSPRAAPRSGLPADLPDMVESYDAYFRSGLYHARYPRPNRRTIRFVRRYLGSGRLLDFGAGDGRYALPLAGEDGAEVLAVDVSPVARSILAEEAARRGLTKKIEISDGSDAAYRERALGTQSFDAALLAFGVLGHVAGRARRRTILRELRSSLKPDGRLILGLPNAGRRFRAEQRAAADLVAAGRLEAGDILYSRHSQAGDIGLFYHLFRLREIREDLAVAGFRPERVTGESILSERFATSAPLPALADDMLAALLPARCAYDYLVIARRD